MTDLNKLIAIINFNNTGKCKQDTRGTKTLILLQILKINYKKSKSGTGNTTACAPI